MNEFYNNITEPNKELRIRFGEFIKKRRDEIGLSQDDLAKMLDINSATIMKIETGRFAITIDYIEKLAIVLDFELKLIPIN
jgi:ribosome-binding protein aMBF1 (putative translation factor)